MSYQRLILCTVLWAYSGSAFAAQKPVPVPTPADAARMAAEDCLSLSEFDRPFQTYFMTYDRSDEFYGAFSYVLNTCVSHASVLYKPVRTGNGWLLRIDRRQLWPQEADFKVLDKEFQELADIEPYFHTRVEIVVEEKAEQPAKPAEPAAEFEEVRVPTGRKTQEFYFQNGYRYVRWIDETRLEKRRKPAPPKPPEKKGEEKELQAKQLSNEFSLHLLGLDGNTAPIQVLALATATPGTEINACPIMRADWFLYIATSSLAEDNGRYYQFRRIENTKDGKPAEQLWLESLGVDYKVVQNLRSDQRIAKWRSNITGKPRAVEYFFTSSARPTVGPAGVALTRDYFVGKIDFFRHALKNLLNYDYDGTEAMGFLPNGMMSFVLFDGDGNLATFAPDKLVSDRTVPSPHPTILQTPISCFRCHGSTDMWMPATNDVYNTAKGKIGLNIFGDLSSKEGFADTLDRLTGLYAGEMTEFLRLNTNTHAKATFIATNGMSIPDVAEKIGDVYGVYRYNAVTPQMACLELGWVVTADVAVQQFNTILPILPKNDLGFYPETPVAGELRDWDPAKPVYINRDDWEQEYADIMLRVTTEAIRVRKVQP
jgi:hypothetical protein